MLLTHILGANEMAQRSRTERVAHGAAIIVLGLVFPIVVLAQAYLALSALTPEVMGAQHGKTAEEAFAAVRPSLNIANDYALYTVMRLEATNNAVVTNKQIMKIVIMQLGFAVVSVGLMFIVLGIEARVPAEVIATEGIVAAKVEASGVKVDFKTASTGVLVFVVGATMATLGGVLRNEYRTVGVPGYAAGDPKAAESLAWFRSCHEKHADELADCFAQGYYKINEEALK
jgi:hypothetical protein